MQLWEKIGQGINLQDKTKTRRAKNKKHEIIKNRKKRERKREKMREEYELGGGRLKEEKRDRRRVDRKRG